MLFRSDADGGLRGFFKFLTERKGTVVLFLGNAPPDYVPPEFRDDVLSAAEAKGLDFQTVCVLEPGRYLSEIKRRKNEFRRDGEVLPLWRRTAIDQLRVAVSRPTDCLVLLDLAGSAAERAETRKLFIAEETTEEETTEDEVAAEIVDFEALLEELDDDADVTERVHRLLEDADQLLGEQPLLALKRVRQAVKAVGPRRKSRLFDPTLYNHAHQQCARITFHVAHQHAAEIDESRASLMEGIARHAQKADLGETAVLIRRLESFDKRKQHHRALEDIAQIVRATANSSDKLEPWALEEAKRSAGRILGSLRNLAAAPRHARSACSQTERACDAFGFDDEVKESHLERVRATAARALHAAGKAKDALTVIGELSQPPAELEARCREDVGDFSGAADGYERRHMLEDALRCRRAAGETARALELAKQAQDQEALTVLQFLESLRQLRDLAFEVPPDAYRANERSAARELLKSVTKSLKSSGR